ncbi:hypothetical protein ACFQS7_26605 [Dankookia sp. GCM10030260]|uniref:hypothetical protein n=1 Tax=Dankookia sp. GCM10030260 TaxID=3273390 RepID=UPI003609E6B8
MPANPLKEKRWLVVAEDGRHVTLGRHSDPTEQEIAEAGAHLDAAGLAAWLVVSEGGYYGENPVSLLQVRRITAREGAWKDAERRWHQIRDEKLRKG